MKIPVATISKNSAQAYRLVAPPPEAELSKDGPRFVYERLQLGECDAALMPVACLPELADTVEPIGAYGIACQGTVHSVRLFARHPLANLISRDLPIYATPESRTSIQLLRVLCMMDFNRHPRLTNQLEGTEGRLYIGEESLRQGTLLADWPVIRDLGLWWYESTRLPFVYARWVVRRKVDAQSRDLVHEWLESCAQCAATPEGRARMTERAGAITSPGTLDPAYYHRLHARLTLADLQGLRRFHSLIDQEGACHGTA